MKKLIFLFVIITLCFGCNAKNYNNRTISIIDSTEIYKQQIDSIKNINNILKDSFIVHKMIIKNLTDSLDYLNKVNYDEYNNYFALIKIKRYVDICYSNSKNNVFLKGWVNRALKKVNFYVIK